jgi:macrodomain Ter protein organizer (MatP/YcbG family)
MRTKVKNILSGMKDFVQTVLKNRKKYFVDEHVFTRNRRLDLYNLCFF